MFSVIRSKKTGSRNVAHFCLYREKQLKRRLLAILLLTFKKIGIAKSNGDVRIMTGSWEISVCAHEQYKFGQKQRRASGATSGFF